MANWLAPVSRATPTQNASSKFSFTCLTTNTKNATSHIATHRISIHNTHSDAIYNTTPDVHVQINVVSESTAQDFVFKKIKIKRAVIYIPRPMSICSSGRWLIIRWHQSFTKSSTCFSFPFWLCEIFKLWCLYTPHLRDEDMCIVYTDRSCNAPFLDVWFLFCGWGRGITIYTWSNPKWCASIRLNRVAYI